MRDRRRARTVLHRRRFVPSCRASPLDPTKSPTMSAAPPRPERILAEVYGAHDEPRDPQIRERRERRILHATPRYTRPVQTDAANLAWSSSGDASASRTQLRSSEDSSGRRRRRVLRMGRDARSQQRSPRRRSCVVRLHEDVLEVSRVLILSSSGPPGGRLLLPLLDRSRGGEILADSHAGDATWSSSLAYTSSVPSDVASFRSRDTRARRIAAGALRTVAPCASGFPPTRTGACRRGSRQRRRRRPPASLRRDRRSRAATIP